LITIWRLTQSASISFLFMENVTEGLE